MIETKISYGANSSFELRRLKDFAKINKGKQLKDDEYFNGPYPYINGGMKPSGYINIYNNQGPFIAISEGGASAGYSQIFEGNVWVGAHCYVLKTNQNLKYVYYVLKGFEKEIMNRKTGSAMPNLQKSKFNNTLFPIIYNSHKQENIVKYLDKINYILLKQIKKYNKKIELLKEYKESLIYETVTKGLDKNVKMKDSGIDWIDRIPNNWSIKRLKNFCTKKNKITNNENLDALSLSFGEVVKKNIEILEETKMSYQKVDKQDIIINPLNLNFDLKSLRVGVSHIEGCISTGYIILKNKKEDIEYIKYLFHLFDILKMKQLGSGVRQTLNFTLLKNCSFPLPSVIEQKQISIFLNEKTNIINKEIDSLYKKIELMEELIESIIYECVTGKLNIEVDGEKYQKIIESI